MSGATVVAVTSVVVAGILGPAMTAYFAARHQRRQLDHELQRQQGEFAQQIKLRDTEELRSLLDGVAQAIDRASYYSGLAFAAFGSGNLAVEDPKAEETMRSLAGAIKELQRANARLAIRLGPAHKAVLEAQVAHERAEAMAGRITWGMARAQTGALERQDLEAALEDRALSDAARGRFIEAATLLAGTVVGHEGQGCSREPDRDSRWGQC
jgi:hypothetical protein